MTDSLIINNNFTEVEKYELLTQQLCSLVSADDNLISNLANVSAAIKQSFDKISWVGFYLYNGKKLYLGPFQGKVACTNIEIGKGVCGLSAEKLNPIIVSDVNKFEGHIFCDPDSKSEIVIPMIKEGNLIGVLDIDSTEYNAFNITDKHYLVQVCNFLTEKIF